MKRQRCRGPEQAAWLARFDAEHDNFRAALGWCTERGDAEATLRLSTTLWWFWYVRGYHHEGRQWLERSYKDSRNAPQTLRAKALCGTAFLATDQSDFAVARPLFEQSLELYRRLEDKAGIAQALYGLGRVALRQEDQARAAALYEEALDLFKELGAKERIASLLNGLGVFTANRGDFARARSLFEDMPWNCSMLCSPRTVFSLTSGPTGRRTLRNMLGILKSTA